MIVPGYVETFTTGTGFTGATELTNSSDVFIFPSPSAYSPARTEVYVFILLPSGKSLTNYSGTISGFTYLPMTQVASGTTPDGSGDYSLWYRDDVPGQVHPSVTVPRYRWTFNAFTSGERIAYALHRFDECITTNYTIDTGSGGFPTVVNVPTHTPAGTIFDAVGTVLAFDTSSTSHIGTWSAPWDAQSGSRYWGGSGNWQTAFAKYERTSAPVTLTRPVPASTHTSWSASHWRWATCVISGTVGGIPSLGGFHLGRIGMGSNF